MAEDHIYCFCHLFAPFGASTADTENTQTHTSITVLFLRRYLSVTPGSNHLGLISDFTNTHAHTHTHTRTHTVHTVRTFVSVFLCGTYTITSQRNKRTCRHMFHIFTHFFTLVYSCSTSTHAHTNIHAISHQIQDVKSFQNSMLPINTPPSLL